MREARKTIDAPFMPKQAIHVHGTYLQELYGNITGTLIRNLLKDLPSIAPNSVIHDNGCGSGAVTRAILDTNPPTSIQIHATDINIMYLNQLQMTLADKSSPPARIATMDACKLTFPDDTFDLSFTNFVFAGLVNDVAAASHILRTLKPRGTAIIAVWKEMPWHLALENAHYFIRGAGEPMAPFLSKGWYKREQLEQVIAKGWKDVRFVEKTAWLDLGVDMKRWAAIAWTFLATPVGGWQQQDEDRWDDAINFVVEELTKGDWYRVENNVHQIRMVADIVIARK